MCHKRELTSQIAYRILMMYWFWIESVNCRKLPFSNAYLSGLNHIIFCNQAYFSTSSSHHSPLFKCLLLVPNHMHCFIKLGVALHIDSVSPNTPGYKMTGIILDFIVHASVIDFGLLVTQRVPVKSFKPSRVIRSLTQYQQYSKRKREMMLRQIFRLTSNIRNLLTFSIIILHQVLQKSSSIRLCCSI